MNAVEILAGALPVCETPLPPYSAEALSFLDALSRALRGLEEAREYPDLISFAFWCRRANLTRLKEAFGQAETRLGRGVAFHIAPSNVPVNFAFSFAFSLLAGNGNIVRAPSKPFAQTALLCRVLESLFPLHPEVGKRTAIVSYPADMETTVAFCAGADARLIWGGDETIARIRAMVARPRCVDVTFADRYSLCLLDALAVLQADKGELRRLAEAFYNDAYFMDQNACSSPRLVLWSHDDLRGRALFWGALEAVVREKYTLGAQNAVDKYAHLCADAIRLDGIQAVRAGNLLYRLELPALSARAETLRGNSGYFYEYALNSLEELCPAITEKCQTLTYYGHDGQALRAFVVNNRLRGVDRVVPIGSAMDIGVIWDGVDMVAALSRMIVLQ